MLMVNSPVSSIRFTLSISKVHNKIVEGYRVYKQIFFTENVQHQEKYIAKMIYYYCINYFGLYIIIHFILLPITGNHFGFACVQIYGSIGITIKASTLIYRIKS